MAEEFYARKYNDRVLQCVKDSNLHYAVQETPFSLYITLRKKFTSHPDQNILQLPAQTDNELMKATLNQIKLQKEALEIENEGLRAELTAMEIVQSIQLVN